MKFIGIQWELDSLATEEVERQSMKRFLGVLPHTTGNSLLLRAEFWD